MTTNAKVVLITLAIVAGLGLVVCGGGGLALYLIAREAWEEPQNIAIDVTSPERVKRGEAFAIVIRIRNEADRPQVLDSIDVYDSYTQGVRLRRSTPPWRSSSHIFDFMTFDYQISLPAGGELVVEFEAVAENAGDFEGDFDVCINNEVSFISQVVRTIVDDPD